MTATDPLSTIWVALEDAGCDPRGSSWNFYARCPVHDGDSRSLHISEGCDRRVLLNCFAHQCSAEAITKALGLPMSALFPAGHHHARRLRLVDARPRDFTGNTRLLANLLLADERLGAIDWRFERWGCAYCGDQGVMTFVSWRSRPIFCCPSGCSLDTHLQALAGRPARPPGGGMTDGAQALEDAVSGVAGLPSPSSPMEVARELAAARYTDAHGVLLLRHWRAGWWQWRTTHWAEVKHRSVRAAAYAFTEHAEYVDGDKTKPWAPNRHKIVDLLEALAAIIHLPDSTSQPAWIEGDHDGVIVSTANGLLDVATHELLKHPPLFFNQTRSRSASSPTRSTPNAGTASSTTSGTKTSTRFVRRRNGLGMSFQAG